MTKLRYQVQEFNRVFGLKVRTTPGIPADEVIRLHLGMCVEETFELVFACLGVFAQEEQIKQDLEYLQEVIRHSLPKVGLADVADALGDSDYVNESFRDALGIDGEPIADAIHRSNMAKAWVCSSCKGSGGGLDGIDCLVCNGTGRVVRKNEAGKVQKPEGFRPPDVAAELKRQGWRP